MHISTIFRFAVSGALALVSATLLCACSASLPELQYPDGSERVPVRAAASAAIDSSPAAAGPGQHE